MKALQLDFAPHSWRWWLRVTAWWWWMLAAVMTFWAGVAAWTIWSLQSEALELQAHRQSLERRLQARQLPRKAVVPTLISKDAVKAVNAAIVQLNIPWSELLDALERSAMPHVELVELFPDARAHVLRIKAEARNPDDMVRYIERLKQEASFGAVVLSQHDVHVQDKNRPVRFELEVPWQEWGHD
jgi:Tfp pilus assembly protein PilN